MTALARRTQLQADPGWQAYVQKMRPMLVAQTSRILNPAPFMTTQEGG